MELKFLMGADVKIRPIFGCEQIELDYEVVEDCYGYHGFNSPNRPMLR